MPHRDELNPHTLADPAIAYHGASAHIPARHINHQLYVVPARRWVRGTDEQAAEPQNPDCGDSSFAHVLPSHEITLRQAHSNISA
jgi:hypothetical protein